MATAVIAVLTAQAAACAFESAPEAVPDAAIDLTQADGTALIKGEWRYSDAKIVSSTFPAPDSAGKPNGPESPTYDIAPHAGEAGFDDSNWTKIGPDTLTRRRSGGKVCFNWYRINITIPMKIGDFDPSGATVVFETIVDDYAEVWVDGKLPRDYGQTGGSVVRGWNAPNRLIVGENVRPGQHIQLAVFGINGPISAAPANYIWMRSAKLDFYNAPRTVGDSGGHGFVARFDKALDAIVAPEAAVRKLASGFKFAEGPVWSREGFLLFSDIPANKIYCWSPEGTLSVFRTPSGYAGADIAEFGQPGSNGLTLDRRGNLTFCQHGNRRIVRLEPSGAETVLADRYAGKRLNSPNDLVYRSDGALYFTDPPFGLPKAFDDPRRELTVSGVYCLKDGVLKQVSTDLNGPNGLAFSPDEKYLYVDNWDPAKKIVMRYMVHADGSLSDGSVFADLKDAPEPDACDGMKVDWKGNVYVAGPGGIWIFSHAGAHLGTIKVDEDPHNFAFGGPDGRTLYIAAKTGLYAIDLITEGIHP